MLGAGFYNMDCMDALKEYPDGYFDLAVVDPPYGDGNSGGYCRFTPGGWFSRYRQAVKAEEEKDAPKESGPDVDRRGGTWAARYGRKIIGWDKAPGEDYFTELFRVSKNQIIWVGNYFTLPPTRCFLIWRKLSINENFSMAMCEYAWTSFNDNAKVFECAPQGTAAEKLCLRPDTLTGVMEIDSS